MSKTYCSYTDSYVTVLAALALDSSQTRVILNNGYIMDVPSKSLNLNVKTHYAVYYFSRYYDNQWVRESSLPTLTDPDEAVREAARIAGILECATQVFEYVPGDPIPQFRRDS